MLSAIKAIGGPGSLGFLIVCIAIGLTLMLLSRTRRWGRLWIMVVCTGYLLLAFPWVATAISDRLPEVQSHDVRLLGSIDTLVILAGDNMDGRRRQALHVYSVASPRRVWPFGGWLDRDLIRAGMPEALFEHDVHVSTTREQMEQLKHLVAEVRPGRCVLIVSRLQMPRVAALSKSAGLQLMLVASPVDIEPATTGIWRFVPSLAALSVSRDALYEHTALTYYRWRKWI